MMRLFRVLVVCQFGRRGMDCWYIWEEDVGRRVLMKEEERLYFGWNQIKSRSLPGCPALGGILSVVMQRGEVLPKFRFDSGLSWMSLSYLRSLV